MHLKNEMNPQDQSENDFLRELSPALFEQKPNVDDTPPEGYFDEFPDRLMARIENENQKTNHRKIPAYINFRTLSIAAGLALILALIPYFKSVYQSDNATTETIASTYITTDKIDNEVLANYIDTEDLYATVDLDNTELSFPGSEVNSEVIIDYLMDEGVTDQLLLEYTNTNEL